MLGFATNLVKDMKKRFLQAIRSDDIDPSMEIAPVKTLEYIDVTPKSKKKNHKVLQRQTSERVTLPKPVVKGWRERDLKAVKIQWIRDPKDPKDVTHLLVKPVFGDEDGD